MIKVIIEGASSFNAGELVRILLLHPDVEILSVSIPGKGGISLSSIHHGLFGERKIPVTETPDYEHADVAFLCSPDAESLNIEEKYPELKTIYLPLRDYPFNEREGIAYGLSEINRKEMVRGAKSAYVPMPMASLALVALFPLAKHLLIPAEDILNIHITAPADYISPEVVAASEMEIRNMLRRVQTSFNGEVRIDAVPAEDPRGMQCRIDIPSRISHEELEKCYDSIYDDHNFTHRVSFNSCKDVAGTEKCLINPRFDAENNIIHISAVADATMRGGAGEAVHIMNLLLGFHEKIGLDFRALSF